MKTLQRSILTREMLLLNIQQPPETPYSHTIISYEDLFTCESAYLKRGFSTKPACENDDRQPVICPQCFSIVPVGTIEPIALPNTPAAKLLPRSRKARYRECCYVCLDGAHMSLARHCLAFWEWRVYDIRHRIGNLHSTKHYEKAIATLTEYMEVHHGY